MSNGLQVKNCILLTKYEGARSNTFKISIKAADYEKATNPDIWPDKVGVRRYKFFDAQRNTNVLGKSKGSNYNQEWKTKNKDSIHQGFLNFHPPTNEQVRQFYDSFASKSSNPGQSGLMDYPKTRTGYTFSDATRNDGNVIPSFGSSVNTGGEDSRLMNNLNMSLMQNYKESLQSGGMAAPPVNFQNMYQNTQVPYQSPFRVVEGMRGGYSQ